MSGPTPGEVPEPTHNQRTWVVGGGVDRCSVSLRLFGDTLDPDVVTAMLGAPPTNSCRKGDLTRRKHTERVEPRGRWLLQSGQRAGGSLDAVINELLDRLTADPAVWSDLTCQFRVDLFCGLHLDDWNRGVTFHPATLKKVADRGLDLGLDIYFTPDNEPG